MGIGAAEPERTHAGAPRQRPAVTIPQGLPVRGGGGKIKRRPGDLDVGIQGREMDIGRDAPMPHGEQYLDDPGDAGRGLQMTNAGLHGADRAARLRNLTGALGEGLLETIDLDRVAERRPGPMGLDIADGARIHARPGEGLAQQLRLGERIRNRQGLDVTAMILGAAQDQSPDGIAVGQRPAQRLEQDGPDPFAAHIAVGPRIERLAAPVRAEHTGLLEGDEGRRAGQQVHAAHDGGLRAPGLQRLDRPMDRHQRAGAGGIDRLARSTQIEEEGHAIGQHRVRVTGRAVGLDADAAHGQQVGIVIGGHPDEQTGPAARQVRFAIARVLDGLPDGFEKQPLLRVHQLGFARRDVEEQRIELVGVRDPAAPGRLGGRTEIPAVRRGAGDEIPSGLQMVPEGLQVRRLRKDAGQAHYRDRLPACGGAVDGWDRRNLDLGARRSSVGDDRVARLVLGGGGADAEPFGIGAEQMIGERLQGLVLEQDRRCGLQTQGAVDLVRQGRQGDGVETVLGQLGLGVQHLRIQPQNLADDLLQGLHQRLRRRAGLGHRRPRISLDGRLNASGRSRTRAFEAREEPARVAVEDRTLVLPGSERVEQGLGAVGSGQWL